MAKWVSVAASVLFLAVLTWLQPCSGLPVDRRVQKLRRWERESQEPDLSSDDLCFLCEVRASRHGFTVGFQLVVSGNRSL